MPEALTAMEFRLLEYFCRHADEEVCTKEELDAYLWPDEEEGVGGFDRLVSLVRRLRRKIEGDETWTYLHNVHGRGYKFVQPTA